MLSGNFDFVGVGGVIELWLCTSIAEVKDGAVVYVEGPVKIKEQVRFDTQSVFKQITAVMWCFSLPRNLIMNVNKRLFALPLSLKEKCVLH